MLFLKKLSGVDFNIEHRRGGGTEQRDAPLTKTALGPRLLTSSPTNRTLGPGLLTSSTTNGESVRGACYPLIARQDGFRYSSDRKYGMNMEMLSLLCRQTTLLASALGLAILLPRAHADDTNSIENSVVKIFSTVRYPDPYQPWTKRSPSEITGSGVVIDGKHILSNAHVVLYASKMVQANQGGDKLFAHGRGVAPGIDLAVLKLDDNLSSIPIRPAILAPSCRRSRIPSWLMAIPEGGNSLSITKGIVSRIELPSTTARFRTSHSDRRGHQSWQQRRSRRGGR